MNLSVLEISSFTLPSAQRIVLHVQDLLKHNAQLAILDMHFSITNVFLPLCWFSSTNPSLILHSLMPVIGHSPVILVQQNPTFAAENQFLEVMALWEKELLLLDHSTSLLIKGLEFNSNSIKLIHGTTNTSL